MFAETRSDFLDVECQVRHGTFMLYSPLIDASIDTS